MNPLLRIERVDSMDMPGLEPYRTLRSQAGHRSEGLFVAEGAKVVRRLLESGLVPVSFLMTPEWLERMVPSIAPLGPAPRLFVADRKMMEQIVGFRFHQGIMALARIPAEPDLRSLPAEHMIVALDAIHHAENVGVIIRNCAALGADAVIAGENCSSPYLRRSVRNSMGAIFRLPVFHAESLQLMLQQLKRDFGTRILAADAQGGTPIGAESFGGSICIVAGNEEGGIRPGILEECDARICIPMTRHVDSLNVASAVAVFLHAATARRQDRVHRT